MDIQSQKLELFEWLSTIKDAKTIQQLANFKNSIQGDDWWDQIPHKEMKEIKIGLQEAKEGKLIDHSEVMKKYDRWL